MGAKDSNSAMTALMGSFSSPTRSLGIANPGNLHANVSLFSIFSYDLFPDRLDVFGCMCCIIRSKFAINESLKKKKIDK